LTAEPVDAEIVDETPPVALAVVERPTLAVTPNVGAGELVARLDVIRDANAMQTAMVQDVDYGVIPGTGSKPTLLKPGAEKLGVLFQLDVQLVNRKTWDGEHLTVESCATVFHAPTGTRLGYGEGMCTTRERKYGKRKQERTCPVCGVAAIIKGKAEYGGGWVCFKKRNGCGAKFTDGDQTIEAQVVGEIENPDLPDTWNTVVKMAEKRARIDAVLAVTGASALFTQDVEDLPREPAQQQPAAEPSRGGRHQALAAAFRKFSVKASQIRILVREAGGADAENVLDAMDALTPEQAQSIVDRLHREPVPTGGTDVPPPDGFEHPPERPMETIG
jgi:hypothetical protein